MLRIVLVVDGGASVCLLSEKAETGKARRKNKIDVLIKRALRHFFDATLHCP